MARFYQVNLAIWGFHSYCIDLRKCINDDIGNELAKLWLSKRDNVQKLVKCPEELLFLCCFLRDGSYLAGPFWWGYSECRLWTGRGICRLNRSAGLTLYSWNQTKIDLGRHLEQRQWRGWKVGLLWITETEPAGWGWMAACVYLL